MRKVISGIILGLGCAAAFVGLLALVLPQISNPQLQLVLSSFYAPTSQWFVAVVNGLMQFAFANALPLLLTGAGAAVVGAALLTCFHKGEGTQVRVYPSEPPVESNPFAAASPHFEPAVGGDSPLSHFTPILERNQNQTGASNPFARPRQEAAAPAEAPQEKPPVQNPVPIEPPAPALPPDTPIAVCAPMPESSAVPKEAPVPSERQRRRYTPGQSDPKPDQPSSRIRSTMGRHTL